MGRVFYEGQQIQVPDTLNGRDLRKSLGINNDRTVYTTNLDGKNRMISDGETIRVSDGMHVGDLPVTEKG